MEVEVDVLGSPSLIVFVVPVDVKQHLKKKKTKGETVRSLIVVSRFGPAERHKASKRTTPHGEWV